MTFRIYRGLFVS
uniref:Uncharacterized protein n=1 Tax=Anguilla anguilla TaxID=7936 RepID=A0A0E9SIY6_ANGAN